MQSQGREIKHYAREELAVLGKVLTRRRWSQQDRGGQSNIESQHCNRQLPLMNVLFTFCRIILSNSFRNMSSLGTHTQTLWHKHGRKLRTNHSSAQYACSRQRSCDANNNNSRPKTASHVVVAGKAWTHTPTNERPCARSRKHA